MSPFAATRSLKKSLVKDKFGRFVTPSQSDSISSDVIASLLKKNCDLENKLESLELNLSSAQKDLETANSTIIELTSKYQDEFGVFQCKDKNIEPVLSNHEDMTCTCTKNLEKLTVDSMEDDLEIEIAKDNYRYKCEGDIGKEEFSKIPAAKVTTDEKYDTTEHFHNRESFYSLCAISGITLDSLIKVV